MPQSSSELSLNLDTDLDQYFAPLSAGARRKRPSSVLKSPHGLWMVADSRMNSQSALSSYSTIEEDVLDYVGPPSEVADEPFWSVLNPVVLPLVHYWRRSGVLGKCHAAIVFIPAVLVSLCLPTMYFIDSYPEYTALQEEEEEFETQEPFRYPLWFIALQMFVYPIIVGYCLQVPLQISIGKTVYSTWFLYPFIGAFLFLSVYALSIYSWRYSSFYLALLGFVGAASIVMEITNQLVAILQDFSTENDLDLTYIVPKTHLGIYLVCFG